jgi:hypothetical protein
MTDAPIRLSPERAREMIEQDEATALDVVDTHSYEDTEVKIEGAMRIDPEHVPDEYDRVPQDRSVLTY